MRRYEDQILRKAVADVSKALEAKPSAELSSSLLELLKAEAEARAMPTGLEFSRLKEQMDLLKRKVGDLAEELRRRGAGEPRPRGIGAQLG